VLAYVMLTGCSPFAGDTKQETFLNISQVNLDFPDDLFAAVSPAAVDFIRQLLVCEPSERLTASQSLEHAWLQLAQTSTLSQPSISTTPPSIGSPLGQRRSLPISPTAQADYEPLKRCKCAAEVLTSPVDENRTSLKTFAAQGDSSKADDANLVACSQQFCTDTNGIVKTEESYCSTAGVISSFQFSNCASLGSLNEIVRTEEYCKTTNKVDNKMAESVMDDVGKCTGFNKKCNANTACFNAPHDNTTTYIAKVVGNAKHDNFSYKHSAKSQGRTTLCYNSLSDHLKAHNDENVNTYSCNYKIQETNGNATLPRYSKSKLPKTIEHRQVENGLCRETESSSVTLHAPGESSTDVENVQSSSLCNGNASSRVCYVRTKASSYDGATEQFNKSLPRCNGLDSMDILENAEIMV
jgi:serine/threonine protein kinase